MELPLKLDPFTMRVKPALPAETLVGEIEEIAGEVLGVGDDASFPPPQPTRINPAEARMTIADNLRKKPNAMGYFSGLLKIDMKQYPVRSNFNNNGNKCPLSFCVFPGIVSWRSTQENDVGIHVQILTGGDIQFGKVRTPVIRR
jgi:hypothetical protein